MQIPIPPAPKYTVWDNDVPIIINKNYIDVFINDSIIEPYVYNELYYTLTNACKTDIITINLSTFGGVIDSAFMIIDAINRSKGTVIVRLTGTVASAGTMIALACDDIEVAEHTAFMIHNYSGGMTGKGHEMKARQEFQDESLNNTFKTFYSGFLTDEEISDVIDGKDMWMGKDEVLKRWSDRQTYLEGGVDTPIPEEED
jgi:ATP-dependent protease ClpP protease subunit